MKIVIIGPGIMPIPPPGWGALEILIWDMKNYLQKEFNHNVVIINTPNINQIIHQTNQENPDIVHIHYDVFWNIIPKLICKNIILASQYGYLDQKNRWFSEYHTIFNGFLNLKDTYIHCVSPSIKQLYLEHGVKEDRLFVLPNGANDILFKFKKIPDYPNRSIYLGKIEHRKRQYIYQNIPIIDFVGGYQDNKFNSTNKNYLKEWSKETLYNNLTNYANLVLLSDGEAHPLVVSEALICGLGVVVSEYAAANLDRTKPYITVISNNKLDDIDYITQQILENQKKSIEMREEIRQYGLDNFSWKNVITSYNNILNKILKKQIAKKLKLVMIGPATKIPPTGWGAVESLIWDYKLELDKYNIDFKIINQSNNNEIISNVNNFQPDIVHIMYDDFFYLWDSFQCKNVLLTSHYAYIDRLPERLNDCYWDKFNGFINSKAKIMSLSPSVKEMYMRYGVLEDRIRVIHNGANHNLFKYDKVPEYPDRSIYLAKIEYRKRQYLYQKIPFLYFAGNIANSPFNRSNKNYLGEWNKNYLYHNLTNYANLVLLSDGEVHPLVVCEALICGLGVVVSKYAAANLDKNLPWVDIIPDDKLEDIAYVSHIIKENQLKSLKYREKIREYALQNFSWEVIISQYLELLNEWFPNVFEKDLNRITVL